MTNSKILFRPRPLSCAVASVLAMGAAAATFGIPFQAQAKGESADEIMPLCGSGVEKAASADATGNELAFYEIGNGQMIVDYALAEDAQHCVKLTSAGYMMKLAGTSPSAFNIITPGSITYDPTNSPRSFTADTNATALCESYYGNSDGYALSLTDINGDVMGGGSMPGVSSFSYNPTSGLLTPGIMQALHGPWLKCFNAETSNGDPDPAPAAIKQARIFGSFAGAFESNHLKVEYLDANDQPLTDGELTSTIGTPSVYKVRISNQAGAPAYNVRVREFFERGNFGRPVVSAVSCEDESGVCAVGDLDVHGGLKADITELGANQSRTYTLTRQLDGNCNPQTAVCDVLPGDGALLMVAAFANPDLTESDAISADDARTLRIGLIENAPPVASGDSIAVNEGGNPGDTATQLVSGAFSVKDNDEDIEDGGIPTGDVSLDSGPAHASAFTLNPDGTFSYTHDGSETIADEFTYTVKDADGTDSNIATVTITITPVNDAPEAVGTISVSNGLKGMPYLAADKIEPAFDDPDDATLVYTDGGTLPPGLQIVNNVNVGGELKNAVIYGTPTSGTGGRSGAVEHPNGVEFPVSITATDGSGEFAVQTFNMFVYS